jgi:ketosteroid isomerase-like protein
VLAGEIRRDTARAMSQENVEVVREMLAAYLAGDNAAALAALDPEIQFDATVRPDGRIYQGREGVAEAMRVWTGTWESYELETEAMIDAGDCVLVVSRESGRGKGSGVEIEQTVFAVWTLRSGKIVHYKGYLNRDEALEAAGLEE